MTIEKGKAARGKPTWFPLCSLIL